MNRVVKFVVYYYLVAVGLSLMIVAYYSIQDNDVTLANTKKKEARTQYLAAQYRPAFRELKFLRDSLQLSEDALDLNYAHTGFMLSRTDTSGFIKEHFNTEATIDSSEQVLNKTLIEYLNGLDQYRQLSENSSDRRIASLAYNQLGVLTYIFRDIEQLEKEEAALGEAAEYFKQALKKDPSNHFARYNYELIRKKIDYSGMIMIRVQSLIRERKYKEARALLKAAIKKDDLVQKKYSDFIQRIETVIQIDSLSRS